VSFSIPPACWVVHRLKDDDLLGGCLNVHIITNFPCKGVLSVRLSALTIKEDPEPFDGLYDSSAMDLEVARWLNPTYQREILGVPLAEYLEEHLEDGDDGWYERRHDFLGGETVEEYFEH
jgi:hypothetical protein